MAATPRLTTPDAVEVHSGLPTVGTRTVAMLLPIVIVAALVLARGATLSESPVGLDGGAGNATPTELTAFASATIDQALSDGAGIEFEIVQTSTITAREGGPLVQIPDPQDRTKSLGEADRYVMGTLIERGFMTPDGYWMELIHGPEPGSETTYDLTKAQVSRQALILDGIAYRNDGEGWHEADRLPGIGLDPATIAKLAGLVSGAAKDATDIPLEAARLVDVEPVDALLGPETVAVDADALAATIDGLRGPDAAAVRALAATATVEDLPGIIAIDLAASTELLAPVELRFDEGGRLVGLTVLARNTNLEIHDLVVETVIALRYPGSPPTLPKPEPTYVAPSIAPDPDEE